MIIKHPDIDNLAKSIVTSHRTKICRSSVVEKKDEKCCLFHEFEMVMKKIMKNQNGIEKLDII